MSPVDWGEVGEDQHPGVVGKIGELDAAWAEAEAALPEGWTLGLNDSLGHPKGRWEACAELTFDTFLAAYEDTPAAALRALAARLRERAS